MIEKVNSGLFKFHEPKTKLKMVAHPLFGKVEAFFISIDASLIHL